jgi:hypothetical protein
MTRTIWTPAMVKTASRMWAAGTNHREIAQAIAVSHKHLLSYAERHRDRFPKRVDITARREERAAAPIKPKLSASWIGTCWVPHVKREHYSGEIHTLPRVSILNGKEA